MIENKIDLSDVTKEELMAAIMKKYSYLKINLKDIKIEIYLERERILIEESFKMTQNSNSELAKKIDELAVKFNNEKDVNIKMKHLKERSRLIKIVTEKYEKNKLRQNKIDELNKKISELRKGDLLWKHQ